MERNSDFGNDDFGNATAVSLLVYFQKLSTRHRKLFNFLILMMKDSHHFAHLSLFNFSSLQ